MNRFLKAWGLPIIGLFVILISCLLLSGCDRSKDDDDCDIPSGYSEIFRYSEGDYESIEYSNGRHTIVCTSTDDGKHWGKADIWN